MKPAAIRLRLALPDGRRVDWTVAATVDATAEELQDHVARWRPNARLLAYRLPDGKWIRAKERQRELGL